jgi:hypothetical protein
MNFPDYLIDLHSGPSARLPASDVNAVVKFGPHHNTFKYDFKCSSILFMFMCPDSLNTYDYFQNDNGHRSPSSPTIALILGLIYDPPVFYQYQCFAELLELRSSHDGLQSPLN